MGMTFSSDTTELLMSLTEVLEACKNKVTQYRNNIMCKTENPVFEGFMVQQVKF